MCVSWAIKKRPKYEKKHIFYKWPPINLTHNPLLLTPLKILVKYKSFGATPISDYTKITYKNVNVLYNCSVCYIEIIHCYILSCRRDISDAYPRGTRRRGSGRGNSADMGCVPLELRVLLMLIKSRSKCGTSPVGFGRWPKTRRHVHRRAAVSAAFSEGCRALWSVDTRRRWTLSLMRAEPKEWRCSNRQQK